MVRSAQEGEVKERDYVVGSDAAQKVPPGGAIADCADCGKKVLLDAAGVREVGRRPSAVVLCPVCPNKEMLKAMDGLAKQVAPYELRSHFDFDPPEACDWIEATKQELDDRYRWDWTNDSAISVMVTQRRKEPNGLDRQIVVVHGDSFRIEMPKAEAFGIPGFPARRPIRDDPQA